MTELPHGGPAFPLPFRPSDWDAEIDFTIPFPGMSLRDYFAGQAIGHISAYAMADQWGKSGPEWRFAAAQEAYKFADAMLEARKTTA